MPQILTPPLLSEVAKPCLPQIFEDKSMPKSRPPAYYHGVVDLAEKLLKTDPSHLEQTIKTHLAWATSEIERRKTRRAALFVLECRDTESGQIWAVCYRRRIRSVSRHRVAAQAAAIRSGNFSDISDLLNGGAADE